MTVMIISNEAIAPVVIKTASMTRRIFPSRRLLVMEATAEEMEKNTSGTTAVKRRFRKISPNGLKKTAFSLNISPRADPANKARIRMIEKL